MHFLSLSLVSLAFSSTTVAQGWPRRPPGGGRPWHWGGPRHGDSGYWFDEFQSVLDTMQTTYFNGSTWPSTIQWISAFFDTLLAASERSFTNALIEYDGRVPGSRTSPEQIHAEIEKYYEQIESFFTGEDVNQIFDAAYDDAQWVVLEQLEILKFIKQYDAYAQSDLGQDYVARHAHRAHIFYNIVQDKFNTSLCGGGLTWNPALAPYKNAITNELFVSSSIGMYLYYTGDSNTNPYPSPTYLDATNNTLPQLQPLQAHDPLLLNNAIKEYDWLKTHNFTNAQGLYVDGFHISDGQTTCDERNEMVYTYNQGVVLSGLRQLWEATGDTQYLDDGYALVNVVINATGWNAHRYDEAGEWAGLGRNGIMEDYCDAPANCSQDAQAFKGIYFHHLDLFCEPLPTQNALIPDLTHVASANLAGEHAHRCLSYAPWIKHNAHAALSTRNGSDIIGGWWGASYVNKTQGPWPGYSAPMPPNSVDEWNHPEVLSQPPWACRGHHGCRRGGRGGHGEAMVKVFRSRKRQSDPNDQGRGRTVETEASGVSVVKAASDFSLKRPAT